MKDYLKCTLTEDEKNEILGIIWMVHKNHKHLLYKKQKREVPLIEQLDGVYEDCYNIGKIFFKDYRDSLTPLTEQEKTEIVNKLNTVIDELCLFELKRTLTFNEKLVFFFVLMENYKKEQVALLLNVDRRTIYNRIKSTNAKLEVIKEAMDLWLNLITIHYQMKK